MKKILSIVIILFISWSGMAQCNCDSADVTLEDVSPSSYTFLANTSYCIKGTVNIQWSGSTFQNNSSICIHPGATFRTNDLISASTSNLVTMNIGVNAEFIFAGDIPMSLDVTIENQGEMKPLWGDLTVVGEDFNLNVKAGGIFDFNTVNINTTNSVSMTNEGLIDVSNFNVNNPVNSFTLNSSGLVNATYVKIAPTDAINITNSGTIDAINFTINDADVVEINNSNLIDLELFTVSSADSNFTFNNAADGQLLLHSQNSPANLHLDEGNFIIVNHGDFSIDGQLSLDDATLNLTNSGTISTDGNFNWGSSGEANYLYNTGTLNVGGHMSSEDCLLSFFNYSGGTLYLNDHMTYGTQGPNEFENYGDFHADGLYSNDPTLHMKNEGTMTLESNYGDTGSSVFSNCGTLNMENWFNLNGKIINTGNYNVPNGSISFASGSKIENYSIMNLKQIVMNNNTLFYNEGQVIFSEAPNTTIKFAGPGSTYQPSNSTSSNYGQFKWPGSQSNQSGWCDGNLNFVTTTPGSVDDSSYAGMFGQWTNVTFGPDIVFGSCDSCTIITEYDLCANADGTWPDPEPTGPDCIPVNRHIRSKI